MLYTYSEQHQVNNTTISYINICIYRYHFLFCELLNRNSSYQSLSDIRPSLRISKVEGESPSSSISSPCSTSSSTSRGRARGSPSYALTCPSQRRSLSQYRFFRLLDYLELNCKKNFPQNPSWLGVQDSKTACKFNLRPLAPV